MFYFIQKENCIKSSGLLHIFVSSLCNQSFLHLEPSVQTLIFQQKFLICYLASVNFTEIKVDSHTHAAPNRLKHCPTVESVTGFRKYIMESDQIRSVTQSCPTLCDPMYCSTPGLLVPHQLPEFTQTHVHRVGDAIQPSHPLSSPSPPAPNPSQHQSLFQ